MEDNKKDLTEADVNVMNWIELAQKEILIEPLIKR